MQISAGDIAFNMSSSKSAWITKPLVLEMKCLPSATEWLNASPLFVRTNYSFGLKKNTLKIQKSNETICFKSNMIKSLWQTSSIGFRPNQEKVMTARIV